VNIKRKETLDPSMTHGKPLAVGVKTLCQILDIGNTKAWELIGTGRVESFSIGRKRLITYDSIEKLISSGVS